MTDANEREQSTRAEFDSYEDGRGAARADHRPARLRPGRAARDARPLHRGPRAGQLLRAPSSTPSARDCGSCASTSSPRSSTPPRPRAAPDQDSLSRAIAASTVPRACFSSAAPQRTRTGSLGALEEDVGELDLLAAPRLRDGEPVDRLLDLVAPRQLARARRRRPCRSCSRRSAAARGRSRRGGRSSRAGRCRRPRSAAIPRRGCGRRAPARRTAPTRARRGAARAGASSESSPTPPASAEAATRRTSSAPRLSPFVRLAPLEQGMYRAAPRRAPSSPAPPSPRSARSLSSSRSSAPSSWAVRAV